MSKYDVLIYHNCANAYRAIIEANNAGEAEDKARALWREDGGAQFIRSDDEDYQGELEVQECKELPNE